MSGPRILGVVVDEHELKALKSELARAHRRIKQLETDLGAARMRLEAQDRDPVELAKVLRITINEVQLSVRAHNALLNTGVHHLGDLVTKDEGTLLRVKNFGRRTLTEVKGMLADHSLWLGMNAADLPDWRSTICTPCNGTGFDGPEWCPHCNGGHRE